MSDLVGAALWLAARGCHVFPCDHPELTTCAGLRTASHDPSGCDTRGKHPVVRWGSRATTDPDLIRMWWRHPRNIGVACGPSRLLVVDEDEPGAFEQWAEQEGVAVPATLIVRTGRGRHLWFRQPPDRQLGNARGSLAGWHIDVRGGGGYVIGPGSVHASGRRYEPVDVSMAPAPAPGWLVSALRDTSPAATHPPATPPAPGAGYDPIEPLARHVRAAAVGERNSRLFWAACRAGEHIAAGRATQETATAALLDAARSVGLGDREAAATITSGIRRATT